MESKNKTIEITKASGELVEFSKAKLESSLKRSGADYDEIQNIIAEVELMLYPGISTKKIYKKAFSLLKKTSRPKAAKYKLKRAIMELGPTGFPFERYIAEVLKAQGYQVKVGEIVQGHCVFHEVDVIAEKEDEVHLMECKFHSENARVCNVKIPLYIHSRFLDIEKQRMKRKEKDERSHQGWIVTNTRFSSDALKYGKCSGLKLMGWDYPEVGSLKDRIDATGLHPITSLTTLTLREKKALLDNEIVMCKDLSLNKKILIKVGIHQDRVPRIINEAKALCNL